MYKSSGRYPLFLPLLYLAGTAASSACFRSATRSSASSSPTDNLGQNFEFSRLFSKIREILLCKSCTYYKICVLHSYYVQISSILSSTKVGKYTGLKVFMLSAKLVMKFALPPLSHPLPSGEKISKENMHKPTNHN